MGASLSPPPPRIRLRVGVTGHRVPPKLPMQSEAPLRALLDHILATIVETARNPDSDFPGGAAANAESAFVMPTLGSALGAIYAQGDFKTVAEQSKRTAARLAVLDKILAEEPLEFARLADRVQKTSDIMMVDLEEWQTVFRARPLSLPA